MKSTIVAVVIAVAIAVVVASPAEPGRVKRLTTFSKPPDNQQPPVGTRECKSQKDCTIKGTSCSEDRRDSRNRCLCEDGNPPTSGQCPNRKRALREKCNKDEDCIPRAHCTNNATISKIHKVCVCEADVEEVDNACGGCERVAEAGSFLIAMGIAAYFLEGRP